MGWEHKPAGTDQIAVQTCPLCSNSNYKFFMNTETGLHDCKVCGAVGNLYQLKEKLGLSMENVSSLKDAATNAAPSSPLPNSEAAHKQLFTQVFEDVLDYAVAERKLSMAIIEKMKLGGCTVKGTRWLYIPYLDAAGKQYYFKARSIPPESKQFTQPSGREACLFNEQVITADMDELVLCEGEIDALSLMTLGFDQVVGVPGANVKKAAWIEKLDTLKPKQIYILYDKDKVGQEAAKELSSRIGIDRVKNIVLPDFEVDGKPGKDVNDYLRAGFTLADFLELKAQAKPFDVQGVQSVVEILRDLRDDIEGKGTEPKYSTKWPTLTKRMGGYEDGDLVGWLAEAKAGKTTAVLNELQHQATLGYPGFLFCQEMLPKRMVRKWVSHVTSTNDTPGASLITPQTVDDALLIAGQMQADILFGFTKSCKADDIYETIRNAVRRYGVKIVAFDNLQMMVRSLEHSTQETSKYTKMFKQIAMELNVVIHLVIQPNRVADGQIVAARNAMGSSAIEKDVDCMVCLHRNRVAKIRESDFNGFLETDDNFEPQMLARVDLSRYASGGSCTLYMDGATSTVREYMKEEYVPAAPFLVDASKAQPV